MDLMQTFLEILAGNGLGVAIAAYFMYKDNRESKMREEQEKVRLEQEKARIDADASQTEVLRELTTTINSLKDLVIAMSEKI